MPLSLPYLFQEQGEGGLRSCCLRPLPPQTPAGKETGSCPALTWAWNRGGGVCLTSTEPLFSP